MTGVAQPSFGSAGSWGAMPDAKYGWAWWASVGGTTLNGTRTRREDALADAQRAYGKLQDSRRRGAGDL